MITQRKYRKAMEQEISARKPPRDFETWLLETMALVGIIVICILFLVMVGSILWAMYEVIFAHAPLLDIKVGHTRIVIK